MSSKPQNKLSLPSKKDSTVAIVIGQQRRISDIKDNANSSESTLKPIDTCSHIENHVRKADENQIMKDNVISSNEVIGNNHNKKKFLINDILQQKTLQEQAIPASPNRLQLLSLFARGMIENKMTYVYALRM